MNYQEELDEMRQMLDEAVLGVSALGDVLGELADNLILAGGALERLRAALRGPADPPA
jgi:hypothetical protein